MPESSILGYQLSEVHFHISHYIGISTLINCYTTGCVRYIDGDYAGIDGGLCYFLRDKVGYVNEVDPFFCLDEKGNHIFTPQTNNQK